MFPKFCDAVKNKEGITHVENNSSLKGRKILGTHHPRSKSSGKLLHRTRNPSVLKVIVITYCA
jgi:hypothetical protein